MTILERISVEISEELYSKMKAYNENYAQRRRVAREIEIVDKNIIHLQEVRDGLYSQLGSYQVRGEALQELLDAIEKEIR
jgi:hypothetical protein